VLGQLASILRGRIEEFSKLIVGEQGKPLREARAEVAKAIDVAEWFAQESRRLREEGVPGDTFRRRMRIVPHAAGVVAAITASNQPLALPMRKLAPAFAAGCAVILKPSEETPLSALALADAFAEAGLDDGLLRVLPTSRPQDLVEVFYEHPDIRIISYTGSASSGRMIAAGASRGLKRTILELGGVAPFAAFDDTDIESAVEGLVQAKFRTTGQNCIAPNIAYVHAAIYAPFCEALVARARRLRIGPGMSDPDLGPLVNDAVRQNAIEITSDAIRCGADVRLDGVSRSPGYFLEPTILENPGPQARIFTDEVFGPVLAVVPFQSDGEFVDRIACLKAGLALYLYTDDQSRIERFISELPYGVIGVNDYRPTDVRAPFGGLRESGIGKENGVEGIREYLDFKCVSQCFE